MTAPLVRTPAVLALALAAAACGGQGGANTAPAPASTPAQQAETAAFVTTIGSDTVGVERYTRTATTLTGELVARSPRTTLRTYTAQLRPDGSVAQVEVTTRVANAPPSAPPTVSTVRFGGDTADVRSVRGDSVQTLRVAGAFPLVAGSYAFQEQAMIHARRAGRADATVQFVSPGNPRPVPIEFRALGGDAGTLNFIAGTQRVRTDAQGRLLALDGSGSTQKVVVTRVATADVAGLGAQFARREASGQGLGTLSPRDTAESTVGGARISIDYGRPLKRGRTVMGEVVPLDQVWRTGANAATILRTNRDLVIGGTAVPDGGVLALHPPLARRVEADRQPPDGAVGDGVPCGAGPGAHRPAAPHGAAGGGAVHHPRRSGDGERRDAADAVGRLRAFGAGGSTVTEHHTETRKGRQGLPSLPCLCVMLC
jgi:hypothetical protein